MPNCSALPATTPQASQVVRRSASTPRAGQHQHRDLGQVPHHRRGVGEEELPVAVEDAQAPRREHQEPGAGEEDAGELDRLGEGRGPGLGEATHHQPDDPRRAEDPQRHQQRHHQREQPEHRPCHPVGVLALRPSPEEPGVDGDERGREHPLAEEVLEDVGDPQRGGEGPGERRDAEEVGEGPLTDEAHQPREEDAQRHQRGAPARALRLGMGVRHARKPPDSTGNWRTVTAGCAVPPRWGRCVAVALLCAGASAAEPEPSPGPLPWQEPSPPSRLFLQQPFQAPEPEPSGLGRPPGLGQHLLRLLRRRAGTQVQFDEETLTLFLTGTLAVGERLGLNAHGARRPAVRRLARPDPQRGGGRVQPELPATPGAAVPDRRPHRDRQRRHARPVRARRSRWETSRLGAQQLLLTADGSPPGARRCAERSSCPPGVDLAGSGTFDVGRGRAPRLGAGLAGHRTSPRRGAARRAARPSGSGHPPVRKRPARVRLPRGDRPVTLHLQLSGHTSPLDVPDASSLSDAHLVPGHRRRLGAVAHRGPAFRAGGEPLQLQPRRRLHA